MRTPYTDTDNRHTSLLSKHPKPILPHSLRLASLPCKLLHFSRNVIWGLYLYAPGGVALGVPIHHDGYITKFITYQATGVTRSISEIEPFFAGDRISIYGQIVVPTVTLKVRINGVSVINLTGHANAVTFATLSIHFLRNM